MQLISIKLSTFTFLSKLHSISLMPLQRKTKKTGVKNTQAPKNSQFLSRPKRACEETNVTFWYKECSILTFDLRNSFIDVQNQHFIIGHVTVMVSNYVTTPQTASTTILKVSALTLYTLISVCIFSILFSKYFLRCQHGEFV